MSHIPHDLAADFPEFAERIHALKTSNAHFRRLFAEYEDVNNAVHRAETRIDAISDEAETDLRHRRSTLKDELYAMLKAEDA